MPSRETRTLGALCFLPCSAVDLFIAANLFLDAPSHFPWCCKVCHCKLTIQSLGYRLSRWSPAQATMTLIGEIRDWRDPGLEPAKRWATVAVVIWLLASIQTLPQRSEGLHTDQSTNCIHTHIRVRGGWGLRQGHFSRVTAVSHSSSFPMSAHEH